MIEVHVEINRDTGAYTVTAPFGIKVSVSYVAVEGSAVSKERISSMAAELSTMPIIHNERKIQTSNYSDTTSALSPTDTTARVMSPFTPITFGGGVAVEKHTVVTKGLTEQDSDSVTIDQYLRGMTFSDKHSIIIETILSQTNYKDISRENIIKLARYRCTRTDYSAIMRALCRMDLIPPFWIKGSCYITSKADRIFDMVMYDRNQLISSISQTIDSPSTVKNMFRTLIISEKIKRYVEENNLEVTIHPTYRCFRMMVNHLLVALHDANNELSQQRLAKMYPGCGTYAQHVKSTYTHLS